MKARLKMWYYNTIYFPIYLFTSTTKIIYKYIYSLLFINS